MDPILRSVASLIADPGVVISIQALLEIDHELFSMVILLLLIQEGLFSVTSERICTKYWLTTLSSLPRKKCC